METVGSYSTIFGNTHETFVERPWLELGRTVTRRCRHTLSEVQERSSETQQILRDALEKQSEKMHDEVVKRNEGLGPLLVL